jgi:hypothetical protein
MKTSFRVHRYPIKPEINQIVSQQVSACVAQTADYISKFRLWRMIAALIASAAAT